MPVSLAAKSELPGALSFAIDASGFPTRAGADGPERHWFIATIRCDCPAGMPEGAGGDVAHVSGSAAIATTPTTVFGVITPPGVTRGLAFAATLSELTVAPASDVSTTIDRAAALDIVHSDWTIRAQGVFAVMGGRQNPNHEGKLLVALGGSSRAAGSIAGQTGATARRYLPQMVTVAAVLILGIAGMVSAAVWPIVVR